MKRLGTFLVILALLAGGAYLWRDALAPYLPKEVAELIGAKPVPPSVAKAPDSPAGTGTDATTPVSAPGEVVPPAKTREPYVAPKEVEFAFRRLEIDTSKETPEACLVFTR